MISVLLPSRRHYLVGRSITNLIATCHAPEMVEILVRLDGSEHCEFGCDQLKVIIGERYGYEGLHRYYNELCQRARGYWMMLWNDDAMMKTEGWDTRIEASKRGVKVLNTGQWFLFPVMSRDLYNIMGHMSLNAHCDSWLEAVGNQAGIVQDCPLEIEHLRPNDEVRQETLEAMRRTNPEFFQSNTQELIRQDAEAVKNATNNR